MHRAPFGRGVETLRTMVQCCGAWGVPAVTVYAFSQENWNRDMEEVNNLMALLERALRDELPALVEQGVRVSVMVRECGRRGGGEGVKGSVRASERG